MQQKQRERWENEMVNGLERKLADFTNDLNFDDIPETAITASKMRILDSVGVAIAAFEAKPCNCLLYTSPSPRDQRGSRMPSSA